MCRITDDNEINVICVIVSVIQYYYRPISLQYHRYLDRSIIPAHVLLPTASRPSLRAPDFLQRAFLLLQLRSTPGCADIPGPSDGGVLFLEKCQRPARNTAAFAKNNTKTLTFCKKKVYNGKFRIMHYKMELSSAKRTR